MGALTTQPSRTAPLSFIAIVNVIWVLPSGTAPLSVIDTVNVI